ncbi:hypothetical protein FAZ69_05080 [Trinickia terrae]|uniref:LysR substrate-binding domain-containing protein n=1 Tax=Trinickia terrae TaxID=2571161 RepID=A0A4U1IDT7_9BURK|nr:hypothetical protein FAZ69_05080 [Trinickia terrae]
MPGGIAAARASATGHRAGHVVAGRLRKSLRSRVEAASYDALCRMVECGVGIGILTMCRASYGRPPEWRR